MIKAGETHELDPPAGVPEPIGHQSPVLNPHVRIVIAVEDQDRRPDRGRILRGRSFPDVRPAADEVAKQPEIGPAAQFLLVRFRSLTGAIATIAAIEGGIDHAGLQRGIAAIGPAQDCELRGVGNSLPTSQRPADVYVADRDSPGLEAVALEPRSP